MIQKLLFLIALLPLFCIVQETAKSSKNHINYKDITILNETKDIPGFEGTLEALNEITILK